MGDSGMGFGGFLLGLGGGWYVFKYVTADVDTLSYLLIIAGVGIILNALLSRGRGRSPIQGLFGGLIGGLFLALFLTQGFTFIESVTDEFGSITEGQYRATETKTLSGDVTLEKLYLEVDDKNGAITVETWDRPGYRVDLTIRAKGSSDSQAQENIERLEVVFSDGVSYDTQSLELRFEPPSNNWNLYAVDVVVKLPAGVQVDLNLDTSNGEITVSDVTGRDMILDTSNGRVTLDKVSADTLSASTSNGQIRGEVEATSATIDTSNGSIDLTLPCTRSGSYELDTSNGAIHLTLPTDSSIGYDVYLKTSVGSVNVNLPTMGYTTNESRRKVGATTGYDEKQVQIRIKAETSVGSVELN
ncbi:DUF4097 family beta strand repeat protein [Candidatus Bathyarchaeota archaeon]|nr:DUF4097 family beta strand repeat protein [Candidatus Bathyarchaeota archaeon]